VPFGRAGCPGANQSFGLRVCPLAGSLVWGRDAISARRNEHTGGTEAGLTRNAGAKFGHDSCSFIRRLASPHNLRADEMRVLQSQ
jgi:hypothetical protein